ncbi:hypothetical protein Tco_0984873, partial [Tanacetum coccineum]
MPEKLHDTNSEIIFGELAYNFFFLSDSKIILRLGNIFIPDSQLILGQSSSKHSNLEVGRIDHRSWVMGAPQSEVLGRIKPLTLVVGQIVPAFLKELVCRVLELLVPLLELNRFKILLSELEEGQVASRGWPFVSAVPGQMTHLVASLTLDSAGSCVMQGTFLTHGKASGIPTVFSWGGSISPDSFLPLYSVVV